MDCEHSVEENTPPMDAHYDRTRIHFNPTIQPTPITQLAMAITQQHRVKYFM